MHEAGGFSRIAPASAAVHLGAVFVSRRRLVARQHQLWRPRPAKDPLQHAPPLHHVGQATPGFGLETVGQGGEPPPRRRHPGLDPAAQQPRQDRRRAAAGNRDGQRITVHDGGRYVAAQRRPIHHVDRHAERLGGGRERGEFRFV